MRRLTTVATIAAAAVVTLRLAPALADSADSADTADTADLADSADGSDLAGGPGRAGLSRLLGVRDNRDDATAALTDSAAGVGGIKIGGYLRPELVMTYSPLAQPRDRTDYGIGSTRAGLMIRGEPIASFHAALDLSFGARSRADDGDDGDSEPGFAVAGALVTWRPDPRFALTVGRRRVPFTLASSISGNALLFPARVRLHDELSGDQEIGLFATGNSSDRTVMASVGVWNGSGQDAGTMGEAPRGILASARIDWSPWGAMPFQEADMERGPMRISAGAGATYRSLTHYDAAGLAGVRERDLRASASLRLSARGLLLLGELLRRQITDSLSSRPAVATGGYAQASYFAVAGNVGLAPMARLGILRDRQQVMPATGTSVEAGVALFPRPHDPRPDHVRLALSYEGATDAVTGERTHRVTSQLRLRW